MLTEPIIEVENLSAGFDGRPVLTDVSFRAYPNQVTIILGGSGSGKSTVMKHLIGLYPVQAGSVRIFGQPLEKIGEKRRLSLFRKIGVLYQNGALLNSLTVAENVALPLEQHTRLPEAMIDKLVRLKLKLVNLEQAYALFPSQLSGGMRKRAALARAIAMDPPLLFCDEPGDGLDPVLLRDLDGLILKLKEQLGISIILVTHEVASIFRLADRIIFLDSGNVLFEGDLEAARQSTIPAVEQFFASASRR